MRRTFLFIILAFCAASGFAATPTLVQSTYAENSQAPGSGTPTWNPCAAGATNFYYCVEFPEPVQSGNLLVCEAFGANTAAPTYTITDDKGQTWTLASGNFPFTSASGNIYNIWYKANSSSGVRKITVAGGTADSGFFDLKCQEFYNVATSSPVDGTANCHTVTSTTLTGVATGTLTTGDLVIQSSDNDNATAIASFTAGSQSNITWNLLAVDRLDGYAVQGGVYNATATFTPQMTSGTSQPFTSCNVQFKSASAGTAPTQAFRILNDGAFAMPASGTTQTIQFPASGNTEIVSFTGGGDSISSISSTPSNTWSSTGSVAGGASITASSQIYYACPASTGTTMTISITRTGTLTQDTVHVYDMTGGATSCFDNDSGGQTGTGGTVVTSLTTCSACLSPTTSTGVVIINANWNFETAVAMSAPSGAVFDSAVTNYNLVNGPEPVDQNGGWGHFYNASTGSITVTWTLVSDGTNAPGGWAGRAAHFLAASAGGTTIIPALPLLGVGVGEKSEPVLVQ